MSLAKLKDLLCRGQHDVHPNKTLFVDTAGKISSESKSEYEASANTPSSRYIVSVTVMKRRRTSPQVLLKASITTVLVVTVAFIILYTILLKYFSNSNVPYMPQEWEMVRNRHHRPKLIPRPMSNDDINRHQTVKWNVSDIDRNKQIFNKRLCQGKYQYLVLVISSREKFERRSAIRRTWCRPERYRLPLDAWKCVFLVGNGDAYAQPLDKDKEMINIKLEEEIGQYNDILKGSYVDTYRNLTYKVLHGLYWASRSCPSEFVLKTDDDCFVNTNILHILILHHKDASNLYIGSVYKKHDKLKVIRDPESRWYVSQEGYREEYYPLYASGAGYLLSADVVDKLVAISKFFTPIPNEDAYIGILAKESGIQPTHSARFTLMSVGWTLCNYLYLVVVHKITPAEQEQFLNKTIMAKDSPNCSQNSGQMILTWN